jgi:hypothetical protein
VVGSQYLQEIVGPIIREIARDSLPVEIDPSRLPPDVEPAIIERNSAHLAIITQNLIQKILESVDSVPM